MSKPNWLVDYEKLIKKRKKDAMKKKKAPPQYVPYQWWMKKPRKIIFTNDPEDIFK